VHFAGGGGGNRTRYTKSATPNGLQYNDIINYY